MKKIENIMDMKYIEEIRRNGKEVIKVHEIGLVNEKICSDEDGFYVTLDTEIFITPETRIYICDTKEGKLVTSKSIITKCYALDTITKETNVIELIKLVGNVYVVYNRCLIRKNAHIKFFTDSEIPYKLTIFNFYFVGDKV